MKHSDYKFVISYKSEGVIKTHIETKSFRDEDEAYYHFAGLCTKFDVGPYYYLCSLSAWAT